MPVDIFTFLNYLQENKTDSLGNPGVDAVSATNEMNKEKKEETTPKLTQEEKTEQARKNHEIKIRALLLRKGFTEAEPSDDSKNKLEDTQFSFYDRDTTKGKPDLEVNFEGKPVKIELKGIHETSEHQKQASFTLRHESPIKIPVTNKKGEIKDTITLSPSEYHDFITSENQEEGSSTSRLYGLNFKHLAELLKRFGNNPRIAQIFQRLARKKINEEIKKKQLVSSIPHVLESTGSHFSVIGNTKGVHIVHHTQRDRNHINKFLNHIGMHATHEPHEVHFSRSPGVNPRIGESRGPIGFLGISLSPSRHPHFTGKENKTKKEELLQRIAQALEINTRTYNEE
jgi:hypothetical protein